VNKRSCALAAAVVLTVLPLGGCRGDGPDGGGARTAGPPPAATTTTPADNGISARPAGEIVAAASRALRSASSVQVELDYRDKDGPIRMRLRLTRNKRAAGWIEQAGTRVDLVASGGKVYLRSPELWEQQANPELARLIGDRWVLVPPVAVGELTPFAEDLTIGGLADMVFDPGSTPRFLRKRRSTVAGRPTVRLQAADGSYFIAATGKPYPLLVDGVGDHQDIAFSRYDQVPPIRAPKDALDLERLRG
jgi:hypothetical protein